MTMQNITFYNSLTKKKEFFRPLKKGVVRIYNCGPTVYKRPHLGNMRRFLFADFLRRSLELFDYQVIEVTNITDVGHLTRDDIDAGEDKLEKEASAKQMTPQEIADQVTQEYFTDLKALNIQLPHESPRATEHIKEMQTMIERLIERGHAYVTDSGVYYDVHSFEKYGALSGNSLTAIESGARVDVRQEKRHSADFALWKTDDAHHLQQWDSPWGQGYPGWHIECSAMSQAYLGETIDIHTGGEDNRFPHHENEIAQSEGATGKPFVHYWLHNAYLQMSGAKMAKREGTQLTLTSLKERNLSPLAFRLLVLSSHYRKPLDFSWNAIEATQVRLDDLRHTLQRLWEKGAPADKIHQEQADQMVINEFMAGLADDVGTPHAMAVFNSWVTKLNRHLDANDVSSDNLNVAWQTLFVMDRVIGLINPLLFEIEHQTVPPDVQRLIDSREKARRDNDFVMSDSLRDKICKMGYQVEDTPSGPRVIKI